MSDSTDEITIGHLKLLVSAAEGGSFTRAASHAGISPAAVSKIVTRLEQRLGVSLLVRTTRQVRLTDAGEHYIARCRAALDVLQDASKAAMGEQAIPSGRLRISVPTPYAYCRLLPILHNFQQQFPSISLNVQISDRPVSLSADHFDIAIRGFDMADSGMIARKVEDAELVVVAAPSYLDRSAALVTPEDLTLHQCIQFRFPNSGRIAPWSFLVRGSRLELETRGNLVCEDEYLAGITLARAGAGVYQMYRFVVEDDLQSGKLVELLPTYGGTTRPFFVVYPDGESQPARLRAFIDFVVKNVADVCPGRTSAQPPSVNG